MNYLIDTNLLVRAVHREDTACAVARGAMRKLVSARHRLCILPQITAEFWAVSTRPKGEKSNGLGYAPSRAERYISRFESLFSVMLETDEVYAEWKRLVATYRVTGMEVHDTRIVAAMIVHGIEDIVTFNIDDFKQYGGIRVIHPAAI